MKVFKTIRARLLIVPAAAVIAVIVTALICLYGLAAGNRALVAATTATSAVLHFKQADMMHDALRGDVLTALLVGPTGSAADRAATASDVAQHADEFEAEIAQLQTLDLLLEVRAAVDDLAAPLQIYVALAREMVPLALADTGAGKLRFPEFSARFLELETKMGMLGEQIETLGNAATNVDAENTRFVILALSIFGLLATLTFVGTTWVVTRGITRPIARVSAAMKEVGSGNLTLVISDIEDDGEVGEIARSLDGLREKLVMAEVMGKDRERGQAEQQKVTAALRIGLKDLSGGNFTQPIVEPFGGEYEMLRTDFNLTIDRLNLAISKVVSSAESIRARSAEVSRATHDLARRTEIQAATLEQTAAAMDEMTSSVKSAASSTKEMESIVRQARKEAEDSGAVVQGAVAAMVEIEKSSNQISQIIGVIDDIAFQTNLLALNAGVEAARAGDAGRGFAVVASEVGALAQRSSVAAKEIKTLISASTQHVGVGVDQVGLAGSALTSIVERVTQISTLVSNVASGASEQSTGLAEINIGVTQLDQATQQNAAMVEQTTAASQLLNQNAIDLKEMMSQFIVSHTDHAQPGNVLDIASLQERSASALSQRGAAKPARETRAAAAANGASVWQDF
jgi:methyl-accepting chemotaxis protein